jgi:hypothetical protein
MRRALLARLDTPVACLLALMIALSVFTAGQLARSDFDPSAFIVAGDRFSDPNGVPRGVTVLKDSSGYDGQFYYRLALDPFTSKATDAGITLDNPPYRHQRFLYPFIVHLVSFGDARRVPIALVATNFVFFCALAWIAGGLAQSAKRHALWGLLIVANPGFLITYSRDLVEIVEAAFLLGSVLLIRRGKPGWAALTLTLAVLTRETSLIFAVAAALVFAADRLRGRATPRLRWYCFVAPILAFCTMQFTLFLVWGRIPIRAGNVVLGHGPLAGFADSWSNLMARAPGSQLVQVVAVAFVAVSAAIIVHHLFLTKAEPTERLACILYGVLMMSVGALVWSEDIAFLRVFTQAYLFGVIVVLASRPTVTARLMAIVASLAWLTEFGRLVSGDPIKHLLRQMLGGG